MTRSRMMLIALLVTGALLTGAAIAQGAAGVKIISFTGKYTGTATVKRTGDVADISAKGTGVATAIGAGTIVGVGKGDTSQQPCASWEGTGTLTGKKGTIAFKILPGSQACGDEGGTASIVAKAQVVKATGVLKKATGTLKVTGQYDDNAGTFSAKFSGKLKQ